MEIDVREINARPATEYRYRITVYKNAGAAAAYYLDFKKATLRMRQWLIGAYPTSEILDNAYAMELYDVKALEVRAEVARSLFDTYTRMAYTRYEREQLFINGIGLAIVTFVAQYQARLVFSVPLRPALARIYDSLLKNTRVAYIICTTRSLLRTDYMSSKSRLLTAESHPTPMSMKERHQKEMQAFHEEWAEQRRREWRERGGVEASEPPARGIDTELLS